MTNQDYKLKRSDIKLMLIDSADSLLVKYTDEWETFYANLMLFSNYIFNTISNVITGKDAKFNIKIEVIFSKYNVIKEIVNGILSKILKSEYTSKNLDKFIKYKVMDEVLTDAVSNAAKNSKNIGTTDSNFYYDENKGMYIFEKNDIADNGDVLDMETYEINKPKIKNKADLSMLSSKTKKYNINEFQDVDSNYESPNDDFVD